MNKMKQGGMFHSKTCLQFYYHNLPSLFKDGQMKTALNRF